MEIVKIIGIGLISLIIIIIIKQYRPEFAIYISIASGILIILLSMDKLTGIINILTSLSNKTGLNSQYLSILLKITGIAMLTEFAVSICNDAGESAIATKVDLGGKVIIISLSVPIIVALLELIVKILP